MIRLPATVPLLACLVLVAATAGCTVAHGVATLDPGTVPRDGELVQVNGVGAEQVRFLIRFKSGPDPPPPDAEAPQAPDVPEPAAPVVRFAETRLIDTTGRTFAAVDQDVQRDRNAYYVTVTSSAVSPETYELVCQLRLLIGVYQVKVAAGAFRELEGWRADPRSFKFSVFGAGGRSSWWLRELQFE